MTAATCSFMVFFSSTMSALQYLLLGMDHIETALMLAIICFVASLIGLLVVQRAIQSYGRPSIIVFSVSIVMTLSVVLMTSFGMIRTWKDYVSGRYMGFKLPCWKNQFCSISISLCHWISYNFLTFPINAVRHFTKED